MKKILCPTDFSPASYDALTYAAKLTQVLNGELTLLNVQSLFDITPVEFVTGKQFTLKATAERLQAQCNELSNVYNITCSPIVEPTYSRLSSVIRDLSGSYDLVVMGSHGADDLYEFLLGTHTYQAITRALTPVLLIPEGHLYSDIRTAVYAFDYLKERKLPIDPLLKFTRALNCQLTVLQVMEEAHSQKADEDLRDLQFILQHQPDGLLPVRFETIRSSHIAKSIDDYIRDHKPDMLALCTRYRSVMEHLFHKSIIKNISAVCTYPVFVFQE